MTTLDKKIFKLLSIFPNYLQRIIKNKFAVSFCLFLGWMLFFDNDSIIHQFQRKYQIIKLNKEISYYTKVLEETKIEEKALHHNNQYFEKFVREKYLLKRDNEDLFIFSEE